MQLSIYLCSFSSTCFGLTRPSSGAMDVTISLHMQHMVSLVYTPQVSIDKITAYTTCKQEVSRLAGGTANHT